VLPYRALITWIIQNAGVVIDGMVELVPEKGPIIARYLNVSNAHLRATTQEPRPRQRRTVRADGASTSTCQDERLDKMEALLRTYEQTLQRLKQTVQESTTVIAQLRDHLMGPINVRDYDIHSSSFNQGKGSLGSRGMPGRASAKPTPRRRSRL
jgi:hypothetical protein